MKTFQEFLNEAGTDTAQIAGFSRPIGGSDKKEDKKEDKKDGKKKKFDFKDFAKKKEKKDE
jgi:hypothetical protein